MGSSSGGATRARNGERSRRATSGFNKQRVLDVAFHEFARKGLAGARMDDIARSGVTKQHLYYYFKTKERLYDAVLARVPEAAQGAYNRMKEIFDRESWAAAVVDRASPANMKRYRLWRRLWAWEALERSPKTIVREQERRDSWNLAVILVQEAQERGEIDPRFDAEMVALAVEGLVEYPYLLPQETKLITGVLPADDDFGERHLATLHQLLACLRPPGSARADRVAVDS